MLNSGPPVCLPSDVLTGLMVLKEGAVPSAGRLSNKLGRHLEERLPWEKLPAVLPAGSPTFSSHQLPVALFLARHGAFRLLGIRALHSCGVRIPFGFTGGCLMMKVSQALSELVFHYLWNPPPVCDSLVAELCEPFAHSPSSHAHL